MKLSSDGAFGAFELEVVADRQRVIVMPRGELDIATVPALRDAIRELRSDGFTQFVVDLSQTTFIDSSGMHLLIAESRDEGELRVRGASGAVARAFAIAGLADVLAIDQG